MATLENALRDIRESGLIHSRESDGALVYESIIERDFTGLNVKLLLDIVGDASFLSGIDDPQDFPASIWTNIRDDYWERANDRH